MPTQDYSVLNDILGIQAPWQVTGTLVSPESRHLVVQVEHEPSRSGFFGRRAATPVKRHLRWEHLALAGWRCVIQLGLREGEAPPQAAWTGEDPEGFSRGLSRQILDLLLAGATLDQLCVLLRLPIGALWKFKYRMDQGLARPGGPAPAPVQASRPAASAAPAAAAADPLGEASPVWMDLLAGRLALDVRMLGLKLLLSKLQREARLHTDADLHRQAAQEIHRYFVRSRPALAHEWRQIEARVPGAAAPSGPATAPSASTAHSAMPATPALPAASALPPVPTNRPAPEGATALLPDASDPLWLALLEGEHTLDVRTLGLRLLLTKLRGQIRVIDDDEVRMVKLVELHRYFERHQALLGHEIAQLQHWTRH